MPEKYLGKYRRETLRAQWWDYGWNANYFVTLNTAERKHYFGEIVESKLLPAPIGELAEKLWCEIPARFPYAKLGTFIVMPDHMHGIITIDKSSEVQEIERNTTVQIDNTKPGGITGFKNPMLHENLSRIIRWYKGRLSFESHKLQLDFEWQSRYYDHIVRNERALRKIEEYILDNPQMWNEDR
jgi:putative transposase